jgi:hypothetical protein
MAVIRAIFGSHLRRKQLSELSETYKKEGFAHFADSY